jgi:hypothetical protein
MRKFSKKQYLAAGAAAVIVASGAGVAFAYWTSTGHGAGTATTGTASNWTITTDNLQAPNGPLTPGGPSETIDVHVHNPSTGHQQLNTLSVVVAESDGTPWVSWSTCRAADYTVTVPAVPANTDLAGGATYDTVATISMNNLPSNQNGCFNAPVPLYFTAG